MMAFFADDPIVFIDPRLIETLPGSFFLSSSSPPPSLLRPPPSSAPLS